MLKRYNSKKVEEDWPNANFPCTVAPPAHTNAECCVGLIEEARFEEAYRFARSPNPLASICGRVCAHPCETICHRGKIDRPISIRALKRLLTERHGPESKHPNRCHNPESTAERVSNYNNLEVKPHPFSEGEVLDRLSDWDLTAIISHGGRLLNRSPLMLPYGYTLNQVELQVVIVHIRAISDPPYRTSGMVYAKN